MKRKFLGRIKELLTLASSQQLNIAKLIVLRGRRRIGKSRLIEEFSNTKQFYKFSGLAPNEDTTSQDQRDEFGTRFKTLFNLPQVIKSDDWSVLFYLLSEKLQKSYKQGQRLFY